MRVENTPHHAAEHVALSRVVAISMLLSACSANSAYGGNRSSSMDIDKDMAIYAKPSKKQSKSGCIDDGPQIDC